MKLPHVIALSVLVILCAASATLAADPTPPRPKRTNPAYLSEMPTAQKVQAEIQGTDAMDTAASQMGTFWQLQKIIEDMAGQRRWKNQLTPDENRLIGEYRGGYFAAGKPYETFDDNPRWYKMHASYETDSAFRDELLKKFFSQSFRTQYDKATTEIANRDQDREERDKKATAEVEARRTRDEELAKRWLANPPPEVQEYLRKREKKLLWQRELARGMASGRSETQVFVEAIGNELTEKIHPLLSNAPPPAGLALSGVYSGQGGFSIWFYPDYAIVGCNGVQAEAGYVLERKDHQLRIRLMPSPRMGLLKLNENLLKLGPKSSSPDEWQAQRITFALLPDGKMNSSGPIKVTGPVKAGQTQQIMMEQNRIGVNQYTPGAQQDAQGWYVEQRVTRSAPIYEPRTGTCAPGILSPTGPSPVAGSIGALTTTALNIGFGSEDRAAGKMPPPGLRMNGRYFGQSGFDIEFFPECAVIACREAIVAHDYGVTTTGDKVLVDIQNGERPIQFELRSDGTLAASGRVQVTGRVLVDVNEKNEPVFKSVTDTCVLGVLTPAQTASVAPQPAPSAAPGAPAPADAAVLSLATGFTTQPGVTNPLAGKSFYLLKDSVENILTKGGVRPQPEMSAFKSWLISCSSGKPECQKGQAAIDANSATLIKTDLNGNARFAPMSPGTYYVMGIARHNDQLLLWDLKVDLKPGPTAVTLDERNGMPVK